MAYPGSPPLYVEDAACAQAGCIAAACCNPAVGCLNGYVNGAAPEGSRRKQYARWSCWFGSFWLIVQLIILIVVETRS